MKDTIRFSFVAILLGCAVFSAITCGDKMGMGMTAVKEGTFQAIDRYEWVVLVHGLLSSPRAMRKISRALEREGFRVLNFKYDSRNISIREASQQLMEAINEGIPQGARKIHFVTHSLGSIVVRYYLSESMPPQMGRFVMIAPPNHGSTWGRILTDTIPGFEYVMGIAGSEVRSDPGLKLPGPPSCEFAVIAGGTGGTRGINPLIPGDNDGTIAVSETRLEGMRDHLVVKGQHTLLLFHPKVIANVISFLSTGAFLYK